MPQPQTIGESESLSSTAVSLSFDEAVLPPIRAFFVLVVFLPLGAAFLAAVVALELEVPGVTRFGLVVLVVFFCFVTAAGQFAVGLTLGLAVAFDRFFSEVDCGTVAFLTAREFDLADLDGPKDDPARNLSFSLA
jgi:hypothetical protein